jgi:molybdopterin/thiamine biosynthesis adenylyltransferase
MLLVLGLALLIFGLGHVVGVSKPRRWAMLAAVILLVILAHLALPEGAAFRRATGGSAGQWAVVLGLGLIVAVYRRWLGQLANRAKAQEEEAPAKPAPLFSETELDRYARQIIMREIGGPGQKALKQAKVLVIGAGGLGAPALQYLGAMGVGTIGVIDGDTVDNSNLQRQVIHRDEDIGLPKVFSAQRAVEAQNPHVTVRPYHRRLDAENAEALFADYDLILDGTDNFDTRYLSNRVAAKLGKPLISGALAQWEGQLSVFDPAKGSPCYQCVFPEAPAPGLVPTCAEAGVAAPLPGVIGAMMAGEALKLLTGAGQPLLGEMFIYDALYGETRKIRLKKRADCPVCGALHTPEI